MKKNLLLSLILIFALLLSACGKEQAPEPQDPEITDQDFSQVAGEWYEENGYAMITVYDNGGFMYRTMEKDIYGYLVFVEDQQGARYELFDEGNSPVGDGAYLSFYDMPAGQVALIEGLGATRFVDTPMELVQVDWLYADYFENVSSDITLYDQFTITDEEYSVDVAFQTSHDLTDFKLYHTYFKDVDSTGRASFGMDLIYEKGDFKSRIPFVVKMVFPGDSPNNAVSFTDPWTYKTRFFLVEQSGYDGSIELIELDTGE